MERRFRFSTDGLVWKRRDVEECRIVWASPVRPENNMTTVSLPMDELSARVNNWFKEMGILARSPNG